MFNTYKIAAVQITCDRCGKTGDRSATIDDATTAARGWYTEKKADPPQEAMDLLALCPDCLSVVKAA